ncbi:hypothetical protein ROV36_09190 [Pasteurella multocida]|uniref:Uncharacterized protein n=1 Tax=Pasteurella oralis TaxID=1071947 RepID=A0ABW4NWZ3_9PAST|nr:MULTISPECIES: hypothetical protein [Pasteurella]MEB3450934.1 hypothetical protein [Pasteurella multocida]MEB3452653.1 hypothetical protein [Pasteurella multocida]MEB3455111.1 hypothetical protein [Pasteurella multocida]MEB3460574.1 hypothetical protein [Pasteurella multocida]MEB3462389.1 hypothetical protein [Pasteurella multocida]
MIKYTPKHQVKVGGKMSEKDAGIVGKRLATSAMIIAICWGISALIFASAYFIK